jgi:hypothetical protein
LGKPVAGTQLAFVFQLFDPGIELQVALPAKSEPVKMTAETSTRRPRKVKSNRFFIINKAKRMLAPRI